ncbi:hypothetical protein CROQUDRAFT_655000 [Cronartium quercuum f. sp. fusiforme G11]|uniref:Promethin n=1 Tax=Cronartium quercuum f. sp. fusiforme G11 TaxID=708437 RepID=A0A9P6NRK8_9BASI|nr:hypothetical protein CROQUDRAFT_655000 [Cronartium quercuum f. sp. fusiforme G11]
MSPSSSASPVSPDSGKHSVLDDGLGINTVITFLGEKTRQADMHVIAPLRTIFKDAFKNYPTATSYFMIFCGLSLLPILCFIGFSLFATSALLAVSLIFVLTWGGMILGSALFTLLMSLAFLAFATFWIVLVLFSTIFVLRLIYNIQTVFVRKLRDSQVVRDMSQHLHEKRLQKQQEEREANAHRDSMSPLD